MTARPRSSMKPRPSTPSQDREAELLGEVQVEERADHQRRRDAADGVADPEDRRRRRLGPGCIRPKTTTGRPSCASSSVPIKGAKRDMLHVIDDDLAVQYLPAKKIKRHRLALACKPHDVFFFCIVPTRTSTTPGTPTRSRPATRRRRIGFRRCRGGPRASKATRSSSRRIRTPFPSRNGRRARSMSCSKSRSRTPISTTTAIPACCA